jgi:signal transduction histidine kinase
MVAPKSSPPFQDDSILEGVASHVMADINHFFSKERLEQVTIADERVRLARELHDGLLQTLSGTLLQLEAVSALIDENPHAAHQRLREIGDTVADEQRNLRVWIRNLKTRTKVSMVSSTDLARALDALGQQVEKQWGLRVTTTTGGGMISRTQGDEIYRLVQESLAAAGKHAFALTADVGVWISRDCVRVKVADDGLGFPFHGRYDLAMLMERNVGPRSLKERVASLGGNLVLTSTLHGSELEMTLPLHRHLTSGKVSNLPT